MNRAMGFSSKIRRLTAPVCVTIRGEFAIGRIFAPHTHMRVVGVKRALHCLTKNCSRRSLVSGAALSSFPNSYQLLTDVGPVELWATH
jgi:hypothetical protein